MNILEVIKQLRDDLKLWATNNLQALNAKIDEKTIPVDKELNATSTNPVQNKTVTQKFQELSNEIKEAGSSSNIVDDESAEFNIADQAGNVIFKADAEGIHTTDVSAPDDVFAIADKDGNLIFKADAEGIQATDISTPDDEYAIVDKDGNIVFKVDKDGIHSVGMTIGGLPIENGGSLSTLTISAPPTIKGNYPVVADSEFAIEGVIIPKYSKGMVISGDADMSMSLVSPAGKLYAAYYDANNNEWHIREQNFTNYLKGIAHRGLSSKAPENTLSAYRAARKAGFKYVEADVRFTSDDVPVLSHDSSINRVATLNGEPLSQKEEDKIEINQKAFATLQNYRFGNPNVFGDTFADEKLLSFEEFIVYCRNEGLHPYIELKAGTTKTQIQKLVSMVRYYGMAESCTWISFYKASLDAVVEKDKTARIGYVIENVTTPFEPVNGVVESRLATTLSEHIIADILKTKTYSRNSESGELEEISNTPLYTGYNEVFIDTNIYSDDVLNIIKDNGIPVEVWTIDDKATIKALPAAISGVTSNKLDASRVLLNETVSEAPEPGDPEPDPDEPETPAVDVQETTDDITGATTYIITAPDDVVERITNDNGETTVRIGG